MNALHWLNPRPSGRGARQDEPPCMWNGRPYLAARWQFDGRFHVLHEISMDMDGKVTLRYMDEEEFIRAHHIDPEVELRRRRKRKLPLPKRDRAKEGIAP